MIYNDDAIQMSEKICYIVGAGENFGLDFTVRAGDMVIAADGGLAYLEEAGMAADLVIGDFDSLHQKPAHGNVITLSPEKDFTDTFSAIREGESRGYKTFHIYCGTGGRVDHSLANIQSLGYLAQNEMSGYLFGRDYVITLIRNTSISFPECCSGFISVFSYSCKASGVYLNDLKYELKNAELTNTFPIGVSNEFIGAKSTVRVDDGTLMIVFPRGPLPYRH